MSILKILFVGKSDFKYNRIHVLISGLEKLPNVALKKYSIHKRNVITKKEIKELTSWADVIYIPPFRHRDVSYIKKLTAKPIVFDPLISKYLTKVDDYKQPWKAPFKYFLDKIPFSKCDLLIADTQAHKNYFAKTFQIPENKIEVLEVGVNVKEFNNDAIKLKNNQFIVGFYGSFVPLQGTDVIIETAALLKNEKDIIFNIIGNGRTYASAIKKAKELNLSNIHFLGWVEYDYLKIEIQKFDIALGIFGSSLKSDLVIPNKIFHYAAMEKCVLTKDTEGIKEIFTNNENVVLCKNDPEVIAQQILNLKNNEKTRVAIAYNAKQLIGNNYNEISIAKKLVNILIKHKLLSNLSVF